MPRDGKCGIFTHLIFRSDSTSKYKTVFCSVIWHLSESVYKEQAGFSPHSAAWLWNQCSHVMSSLIIIMTSWKSDLPPAHSLPCRDWRLQYSSSALEATLGAEFDLSSLKTSLIRVGHSGTGHLWPRLYKKKKKGRISTEIILSRSGCVWHQTEARAAACVRVGGIGNAALWQIVRYMRLAISAVVSNQFIFAGFGEKSWDLRVDSWTALLLHWRRAVKSPLPCKVSLQSACFLRAWMQVAAYFCYCIWPGAVPTYTVHREAAGSRSPAVGARSTELWVVF